MNHYNVPRWLATGTALLLLSACAHVRHQPAAAAAPAPATVAAPAAASTPAPAMQPTAPLRYTVKKGDTLWGIASMYLKDPWSWPDIWYTNPSIKNPHLIYPGDVLVLGTNAEGHPSLSVERNGETVSEAPAAATQAAVSAVAASTHAAPAAMPVSPSLPVQKLEPQVHYLPLDAAVTSIPIAGLRPYLSKTRILNSHDLDQGGYLLTAFNQSPASGAGEEIYARDLKPAEGTRYEIFREGQKYVDPDSGHTVGYEATYIGDAEVETWGDPSKLLITSSTQEAIAGDRLLPSNGDVVNLNFFPHRPAKTVDGQIMAVQGGVGQIGQYDVLVLNRGSADGIDPGLVLGIYRQGNKVHDSNAGVFHSSTVRLPTERSGTLMVFRTFQNASYALVMQATHEIHVADYVGNP